VELFEASAKKPYHRCLLDLTIGNHIHVLQLPNAFQNASYTEDRIDGEDMLDATILEAGKKTVVEHTPPISRSKLGPQYDCLVDSFLFAFPYGVIFRNLFWLRNFD
jgi:hypothetical protein